MDKEKIESMERKGKEYKRMSVKMFDNSYDSFLYTPKDVVLNDMVNHVGLFGILPFVDRIL